MAAKLDDWGRECNSVAQLPSPAGNGFFHHKRSSAELAQRVVELEEMISRSGQAARRRIEALELQIEQLERGNASAVARRADELETRLRRLEEMVVASSDSPIGLALGAPWVRRLAAAVADHWQVSTLVLVGRSRQAIHTRPRFVFCWLLRQLTSYSTPAIAHFVGYEDHTSVLYGIRRVDEWRQKDEVVLYDTDQLLIIGRRLHGEWLASLKAPAEAPEAQQVLL